MSYTAAMQLYPPGHRYGHPLQWHWTIDELEESGLSNTGDGAVEDMWIAWQKGEDAYRATIEEQKQEESDLSRKRWE